jgi:hypothetical protein
LLGQTGVDAGVRVRSEPGDVEVLRLERARLARPAGLMRLGAPLERELRQRVDGAVGRGRRGLREPRVGGGVAVGQDGQDRQRLDERRERRQRPERRRGPKVLRHALLGDQEPSADPTAGHQPHLHQVAARKTGRDQLLARGKRTQRTTIARVAEQGAHESPLVDPTPPGTGPEVRPARGFASP